MDGLNTIPLAIRVQGQLRHTKALLHLKKYCDGSELI